MDELRDYRFYTEDMLHPNKQAIDYVWSRFQSVYFSKETVSLVNRVESFNKLKNHIFIGSDINEQKKHCEKIIKEKEVLSQIITNFI